MCRCTHHPTRRAVLALLAAAPVLAACKQERAGPEEIRWGRETCEICGMIISDPHFAAEIRGGPDRRLAKFDDIGDALHWLAQQPWKDEAGIEIWVRDYETGTEWLDAWTVHYRSGTMSPMDYGYAAVKYPASDTVDFTTMQAAVLKRGLTWRCGPDGVGGGHEG
jgi:hypothetical protein